MENALYPYLSFRVRYQGTPSRCLMGIKLRNTSAKWEHNMGVGSPRVGALVPMRQWVGARTRHPLGVPLRGVCSVNGHILPLILIRKGRDKSRPYANMGVKSNIPVSHQGGHGDPPLSHVLAI